MIANSNDSQQSRDESKTSNDAVEHEDAGPQIMNHSDTNHPQLEVYCKDKSVLAYGHELYRYSLKFQHTRPELKVLHELRYRKHGTLPKRNMYWFENNVYEYSSMITRFKITKRLDEQRRPLIHCLEFNNSGDLLCSAGYGRFVGIWDWTTGKLRRKFDFHRMTMVTVTKFCNNDNSLITSYHGGCVKILDIETGESDPLITEYDDIRELDFITPHTLVARAAHKGCVKLIDLRTRTQKELFYVRRPKCNRSTLNAVAAHPFDKHKIVVGGDGPYVFLHDLRWIVSNPDEVKPQLCIEVFDQNTTYPLINSIRSIAFNSTGSRLLTLDDRHTLHVHGTTEWRQQYYYNGPSPLIHPVCCAWFGNHCVLSGTDNGLIFAWDFERVRMVCFERFERTDVQSIAVHPHLPPIASSGLSSGITVWEQTSDEPSEWSRT